MAEITTLPEAMSELVHDGDSIALEGFTHLIPFAAGHEIARQGRRHLTLIRLTPDVILDQLIGVGCADALVFSWGGNPGVGSLHRFRDAVENAWPLPLRIEEFSHGGDTGNDLAEHTSSVTPVTCPFTGERLTAVAALRPDVAVIHAQQADRRGNVMLWGITGVQKEAVLAARRSIVTVEEIVDTFAPRPNAVVLPTWAVSAVAVVPGGTHPSYALGYSVRDNGFYRSWDAVSRDRERFRAWMERHVLGVAGWREYQRSLELGVVA
jgi:glutaconate CoA-transferase subunit A